MKICTTFYTNFLFLSKVQIVMLLRLTLPPGPTHPLLRLTLPSGPSHPFLPRFSSTVNRGPFLFIQEANAVIFLNLTGINVIRTKNCEFLQLFFFSIHNPNIISTASLFQNNFDRIPG